METYIKDHDGCLHNLAFVTRVTRTTTPLVKTSLDWGDKKTEFVGDKLQVAISFQDGSTLLFEDDKARHVWNFFEAKAYDPEYSHDGPTLEDIRPEAID